VDIKACGLIFPRFMVQVLSNETTQTFYPVWSGWVISQIGEGVEFILKIGMRLSPCMLVGYAEKLACPATSCYAPIPDAILMMKREEGCGL